MLACQVAVGTKVQLIECPLRRLANLAEMNAAGVGYK